VVVGDDGSGVTNVTDAVTVDVGRPASDVAVAELAALCEVVVTDEATGTTGYGERVTIGGRREVATGGTGGRREVTMGGGKVTIGVSDDAGGITGGSPPIVGKIGGGLVITGVTDGGTIGGEDEAVGGGVSDDAGDVTGEGPPGIGKDERQPLTTVVIDNGTPRAKGRVVTEDVSCDAESVDRDDLSSTGEDRGHSVPAVVTDGGTVGGKDEAVTDDAGGVTGDVPMVIGDDVGLLVPQTKDPPAEDAEDISVKMVLEFNVDGDELDGVTGAAVLVNDIADVVASHAETISSSSPESLATWCKLLYCLKA
jgi:hypothetical protein